MSFMLRAISYQPDKAVYDISSSFKVQKYVSAYWKKLKSIILGFRKIVCCKYYKAIHFMS